MVVVLLCLIAVFNAAMAVLMWKLRRLLILSLEQKTGRPIDTITGLDTAQLKAYNRSDEYEHFIATQRIKDTGAVE